MTARDLTPIEAAVLRMLAKPSSIQMDDIKADFCVRAFIDPSELVQVAFNSVDWDAINAHREQTA